MTPTTLCYPFCLLSGSDLQDVITVRYAQYLRVASFTRLVLLVLMLVTGMPLPRDMFMR